jgi:hypothetical protein
MKAFSCLTVCIALPAPLAWALASTPCFHLEENKRVKWIDLSPFTSPFQMHPTSRHPQNGLLRFSLPPFLVKRQWGREEMLTAKMWKASIPDFLYKSRMLPNCTIGKFPPFIILIYVRSAPVSFLWLHLHCPYTHLMKCSFHFQPQDLQELGETGQRRWTNLCCF